MKQSSNFKSKQLYKILNALFSTRSFLFKMFKTKALSLCYKIKFFNLKDLDKLTILKSFKIAPSKQAIKKKKKEKKKSVRPVRPSLINQSWVRLVERKEMREMEFDQNFLFGREN